jgi:hypothetical protein
MDPEEFGKLRHTQEIFSRGVQVGNSCISHSFLIREKFLIDLIELIAKNMPERTAVIPRLKLLNFNYM